MHVIKVLKRKLISLNPLRSSRKTGYIITDTGIKEKPISVNSDTRDIDTDLYESFQLYLKNFANPIRIDINEKKTKVPKENDFEGTLITSEKYKDTKRQNVIRDLVSATPKSDNILLYILAGSMIMNVIFAILIGVT